MIVKCSSGKSFSGLGRYLTSSPNSPTGDRVAWTHTINCANDHIPSAIDEQVWTFRNAELLKEEAGVRAGGRPLSHPVLHISLSWAPGEEVTREHMIETTESFLSHMKWEEHQAVLVAHDDKAHQHVHVMLNAIHPETGLKLDDSFEKRRAQEWALEYERAHGLHCDQRLENTENREKSMTRDEWLAFKGAEKSFAPRPEYDPHYMGKDKNRAVMNSEEWGILKEVQRKQREDFFAEGKSEFKELRNSIYRDVREEFRGGWADYYEAKREGLDPDRLSEMRAELISGQKSVLEERRDAACAELRERRDDIYRQLLDEQKEARGDLTARQEDGLRSPYLLGYVNQNGDERATGPDVFLEHGGHQDEGGSETTGPETRFGGDDDRTGTEDDLGGFVPAHSGSGVRSGPDIATNLTFGAIGGFASIGERLFDGFFGGAPVPERPVEPVYQPVAVREEPRTNPFAEAAAESRKRAERAREREDDEWWDERRARARD